MSEPLGTDDLFRQMQSDEEEDRAAQTNLIPPIAFARLKGIYPQRVYAWLREGKLETVHCECGRLCVRWQEANDLLEQLNQARKEKGR